jgi:RNA polymerase sigma-70 factor (ECF subfamily)
MQDTQIDRQIERVRNGDLAAYAEVVRETQDRLRAYILWLLPNAGLVDDIAQDTYIYAYQNLDKYAAGTNLLAWLKTIARFRVLNRAQSCAAQARREKRYFDEWVAGYTTDGRDMPERQMDRLAVLRGCMEQLPGKSLEIVKLRYQDDFDSARLAAAQNKSASAIRVSLMRIREQLRRCVEKKLPAEGALS